MVRLGADALTVTSTLVWRLEVWPVATTCAGPTTPKRTALAAAEKVQEPSVGAVPSDTLVTPLMGICSAGPKPVPAAVMLLFGAKLVGFTVIDGAGAVTSRSALARSVLLALPCARGVPHICGAEAGYAERWWQMGLRRQESLPLP